MFLAESQLPVTAIEVGVWIGCASFVLGIVRHVIGIKADSARIKQGTAETPLHLAHPLVMSQAREPALKEDVDEEFDDVDSRLTKLQEHIDKKFAEQAHQAQGRMDVLRSLIATEIASLRAETDRRVESIHEKVNAAMTSAAEHAAHIQNLQSRDYQHDLTLASINQRLTSGVKPR